jgi:hypothetical protein
LLERAVDLTVLLEILERVGGAAESVRHGRERCGAPSINSDETKRGED